MIQIGDKVRIVGYGSSLWCHKDEWLKMFEAGYVKTEKPLNILEETDKTYVYDWQPSIVGREAVVDHFSDDGKLFALSGIPEKSAWYYSHQLEKI